jgi:hypothetical protein
MSFGGIISQGKFTQAATAVVKFIPIPSGVDRIEVLNYTASVDKVAQDGYLYTWQRGMATDGGVYDYYRVSANNADPASDTASIVSHSNIASGGFTLVDSSSALFGAAVAGTAVAWDTDHLEFTVDSAAGVVDGATVVRIFKQTGDGVTNAETIIGQDFLIQTVSGGGTVLETYPLATNPAVTTGSFHYKIMYVDTAFYPRSRVIARITAGTTTEVYTTVPHGLTTGQMIRFSIPATSGMVGLNPSTENLYLSATVTAHATDTKRFTADIDSSSFTAFTYPTSAQDPCSFPRITPIGENSAKAIANDLEISKDAKVNTAQLGMILGLGVAGTGVNGPAGAANDVMYWSAWKAANVTQE